MVAKSITVLKLSSIIISMMVFSGCATLSKQECLMGNWQAIGFVDGAAGRDATQLAAHNKVCARANVAPDYQLWEQGRQEGLKQYCTETNAYAIGKRGRMLNAVCPSTNLQNLERINADGRHYYSLNRQLTVERERLEKYTEEYKKLREGENLSFDNEKEAREYLLTLPEKIKGVQLRIAHLNKSLSELQNQYGY